MRGVVLGVGWECGKSRVPTSFPVVVEGPPLHRRGLGLPNSSTPVPVPDLHFTLALSRRRNALGPPRLCTGDLRVKDTLKEHGTHKGPRTPWTGMRGSGRRFHPYFRKDSVSGLGARCGESLRTLTVGTGRWDHLSPGSVRPTSGGPHPLTEDPRRRK